MVKYDALQNKLNSVFGIYTRDFNITEYFVEAMKKLMGTKSVPEKFYYNVEAFRVVLERATNGALRVLADAIYAAAEHMSIHKTLPPNVEVCSLNESGVKQQFTNPAEVAEHCFSMKEAFRLTTCNVNSGKVESTKMTMSFFSFATYTDAGGRQFFMFLLQDTAHLQILLTGNKDRAVEFMNNFAVRAAFPKICAWCGTEEGTLRTCAVCKQVKYCSKACQKVHFHNGHKNCKEIVETFFGPAQAAARAASAEAQADAVEDQAAASGSVDALGDALSRASRD